MRGRPVVVTVAVLVMAACTPGDPSGETTPTRTGPTMTLPTNPGSSSPPPSTAGPADPRLPRPGECRPTSSVRPRSIRADQPVKIFHFNLWGGPGHNGLPELTDKLTCLVLRDHLTEFGPSGAGPPDLISFNEICRSQYNPVAAELKIAGYDGYFYSDRGIVPNAVSSCGVANPEGVAVFSLRGVAAGSQRGYVVSAASEERRNAACVSTATGPRIRFCTIHPYKGPKIAGPQLERFIPVARRDAAGQPLVIAGDLNQSPSQPSMVRVLKSFDDVDLTDSRPCVPPLGPAFGPPRFPGGQCTFVEPGAKIDFVLVDRDHFRPGSIAAVFDPGACPRGRPLPGTPTPVQGYWPCSDHRQLWGLASLGKVRFPTFAKRWTGPGYTVTIDTLGRVRIDTGKGHWAVGQLLEPSGRDSVRGRITYATPGAARPRFVSGKGFFLHHYLYGTVTTDLQGWQYLCGPDTPRLAPVQVRRSMKLPC